LCENSLKIIQYWYYFGKKNGQSFALHIISGNWPDNSLKDCLWKNYKIYCSAFYVSAFGYQLI